MLRFRANTKYLFVEIINNKTSKTSYRVMAVERFESCVKDYLALIKE